MSEQITPNLTLAECIASYTATRKGLQNIPDAKALIAIRTCAAPGSNACVTSWKSRFL